MKLLKRAALLAASLLVASTPVAVAGTSSESYSTTKPGAELTLYVTELSKDFTYSADLRCMPKGGDHSDAWAACYSLEHVDGQFDKLKPREGEVCTREHDPVVLTATGHWKGEQVYWSKKFSNGCVANNETRGVFEF